jgi:methyl-accepting chemotaxis protein
VESVSPGRPGVANSRVTIVARLVAMAFVAVIAVALISGAAAWGSADQAGATRDIARISDGMSHQWNADMMHDGLRADVMSALYATTAQQRTTFEVDGVTGHASTLLTNYDAAAAVAPGKLAADYARVRPALQTYAETAEKVVALAATDHPAAEAALAGFLTQFGALEEQLGAIDAAMLQAVKAAGDAGAHAAAESRWLLLAAALVGALLTGAAAIFTVRAIRGPLRQMLATLRAAARRDLTVRADVVRRDELGEMAVALNEALTSIRTTVAATATSVGALSSASTDLRALAGDLDASAAQTSVQARSADTAAQQVSESVTDMMAATEQMSASIREIARQTSDAAVTTAHASRSAVETADAVGALSEASREVGDIVKLITAIAEQTNLLALNATIEAARAGESGRGFAVVASEVKALAAQTAKATEEIGTQIAGMQAATQDSVAAIKEIGATITQLSDIATTIAATIEEQGAATTEIARNVGEAAKGTAEVAERITEVNRGASDTGTASSQVLESARSLSVQSSSLRAEVENFLNTVRAA